MCGKFEVLSYVKKFGSRYCVMPCERNGCPYSHKWKTAPKFTYCCNACKQNERYHTRNCTGHGMRVGFTENSVAASSTTPFVAPISLDGAAPTQIGGWKISIPLDWTRRERHVLEVVRWYTTGQVVAH